MVAASASGATRASNGGPSRVRSLGPKPGLSRAPCLGQKPGRNRVPNVRASHVRHAKTVMAGVGVLTARSRENRETIAACTAISGIRMMISTIRHKSMVSTGVIG